MANLFSIVTKATKSFLDVHTISVDNWGFKLFYKVTTAICLFSSAITTTRQFFGSPITCDPGTVRNASSVNHSAGPNVEYTG